MEKAKAEQWAEIGARLQAAGCAMTGGMCGCLLVIGVLLGLLMLLAA